MTTIDRAPDIRPKVSPSLVALGEYGGAGEIELAALEAHEAAVGNAETCLRHDTAKADSN